MYSARHWQQERPKWRWALDGQRETRLTTGTAEVNDASRAPAKGKALLGEEIDDHIVNKKQEYA